MNRILGCLKTTDGLCETVVSFTVAGCYIMFHVSSCLFLLFLRLLRPPRTNPKPTMTRATPFVSFPPRRSGNATARRSRAAWRAPTSSARPWRRSSPGTPRSPRLLGERSAERRAERRAERSAECVKPARVEHGRVWRFVGFPMWFVFGFGAWKTISGGRIGVVFSARQMPQGG